MSRPSEPHAFISYVRDDRHLVDELEKVLAAAGIPVWRDVNNLFPGDNWRQRIRDAIQGNSLAFIPVFSQRSESRDKSQMREEIQLAIGEYRQMAPDRPWIFSVRLDDVPVPKYRIGADEYLNNLQWTDFFGDDKTVAITQLVSRIHSLLEPTVPQIADPAVVAATATDATRGELLSAAVREGRTDPSRANTANELMISEARRVVAAINDTDKFPMDRPAGSMTSALSDRIRDITTLIGPLIESSMELGAHGTPEDADLATQLVTSLAREGFADHIDPRLDAYNRLRKLPAVCVLMAGALGATAKRNADMLTAFVADPHVEAFYQDSPVAAVLTPWDPFGPTWHLAQFVNAATDGGQPVTQDVLDAYDAGNIRRTPAASASTIIRRVLAAPAQRFTVGTQEFHDLFDRTEVLVAAITNDLLLRRGSDNTDVVREWLGNHPRTSRAKRTSKAERMLTELESAGENWWPLRGQGLFSGNHRAALSCLGDLVEIEEKATH